MGAEVVGEAKVLIDADFSTFDDQLKAKLTTAAEKAGAAAERTLKRSGDRAGKNFSDGVSRAAGGAKTLENLRNSIQRLEIASVRAGDAQVDAATRARQAEAALAKIRRTTSTVTLDGAEKIRVAEERVAKAHRDAARAQNLAATAASALGVARAKLVQEGANLGEETGEALARGLSRSANRGAGDAGTSSGGFFARAFRTAAGRAIGTGLFRSLVAGAGGLLTALSPLSTILGGATAAVVALAGALSTAAGSGLALGGVLGSLGLAIGALTVGLSGVGDAMDAQSKAQEELARTGEISKATQEKLDAALKNLAPSAAAVVRQLGAMAPAWEAVRRNVQERLFTGLSKTLAQLGNRYLPILSQQLGTAASSLARAGQVLGAFLNNSSRAGQIAAIFSGLNGILSTLLGPLNGVAAGFFDIFQASLPFAQRLASILATASSAFGQFLSQAAESGSFSKFMETAFATAQQLFRLLGNLGSIIGQVFAAGTASGGNLLTILANITGQFAAFLRSAEGQAALTSFFGLISQAGEILVGVFKTLQPLLAGISSLFRALEQPISVLGGAITEVIGSLAVTIGGLLTQLGPVLGQLVTAFAPIATVLGGVLVGAIQALAPLILQLVSSFAQILPALTPVLQVLGTALITTLGQLSGLLVQILPVVAQIITAFATGLTPVLTTLQPVLAQIVAAAVQLVAAFIPILNSLLPLVPSVTQLAAAFAQLVVALAPLITQGLTSLTQLLVQLAPYIAQLVPPLVSVIGFFTQFTLAIAKVVAAIVGFAVQVQAGMNRATGFVARAVAAIASAFASLIGKIAGVMRSIGTTVAEGVGKVVGFFTQLPGRITGALSALPGQMASLGADIVAGLANGIKSRAESVLNEARNLASKVSGAIGKVLQIGSPSKVTHRQGEFAGDGLANGIRERIPAVRAAAINLANAVPKAVEPMVNKLNTALNSLAKNLPSVIRVRLNQAVASARVGIATIGRAQDALDTKLKAAQSTLQGLLQKSQQLAQSVAQGVLQTGNIAQSTDGGFRGMVSRLQSAVTNAKAFADVIARLSRTALNKTSLQQIIDAGPEAGLAAGRAVLAAGNAGIRQVNTLQSQLQTAASKAAKSASDAIFGQGVRLAQGLVAGLQKQRAALDAQMLRLADVLVARVLKVLRAVKVKGAGTLDIPGFSDGGVIRRDGIYRGAEKNRPEAIVPLTKPRRAQQIMDATGLSAMAAGSGKSRTVEVPIHVAGSVVDYDALTAYFERLFARYGLKPVLGLNVAGGTL